MQVHRLKNHWRGFGAMQFLECGVNGVEARTESDQIDFVWVRHMRANRQREIVLVDNRNG